MDDDVEDGQRVRFNMDADFEGGEWIGGEFFFSKKKQKRTQTRDDALYGVFNESDSDGETKGKGRRRRKDDDIISKGDLSKPVAFVSKGVTNPNEDADKQQKKEPAAADSVGSGNLGLGFAGLGFGGAGLGSTPGLGASSRKGQGEDGDEGEEDALSKSAFGQLIKERAERRKESERERAREEKKAKEEGRSTARWAGESSGKAGGLSSSHPDAKTFGVGLKLLEKMGYKGGGLGKNAQGITKAIEVTMRPKNMGMGFGDFNEKKVGLPARPGSEAAEEGTTAEVQFGAPSSLGGSQGGKEKMWKKKGSARRKQVEYKTAAQLLEEKQAAGKEVTQTILDMRGSQVRVLTNLENLNSEQKAVDDDTPMPELQHNLRLLVDLAEADIQTLDKKLRAERAALVALQDEKERAQARAEETRRQLQSMEAIVRVLDSLEQGRAILDPLEAIAKFRALKEEFQEDYQLLNVSLVALSHAQPHIAALLRGWNPLADPRHGLVEVAMWKEVLTQKDSHSDRAIFADSAGPHSGDPFVRLVANCVLPAVRSTVTNLWEPREPEPLLRFLEDWKASMPDAIVRDILENLVMPKLTAAVNEWNPLKETIPIHQWLHPWLPYLGATSLPSLYPTIQHRLGLVLGAWHPSDSSALAMLAPWRTVFLPAQWEALLSRSIVPKLIAMMQAEFLVNPQQQNLGPFNWALAWAGVLPQQHLVALLDATFFPQWHQVLYHWLCASPDFDEVSRWYLGWKALFPEDVISLERVRSQFNAALDLMNQAVEGMPLVPPGAREHVSFLRATEQEAFASKEKEGKAQPSVGNAAPVADVEMEMGATAGEMSLKEVVEMFAQQHDVKFLPKPGRSHRGLPVFGFGTISMVADGAKQIILAQNESHDWEPVSLQGLLDMHRKRGGRWAV